METGGPSVLTIIFWILAANVILILSAYGITKFLRKKSQNNIRDIAEHIQGYAGQMDQLASFLNSYAGIDQEPYFTPLDELQSEASEIHARLQAFLDVCRAFEEELHAPAGNQLQEIINAPMLAYRRWRRSQELRSESKAIAGQMEAAEKRMQGIYELPLELAAECRKADEQFGELADAAQQLQSTGSRGTALQKVISQLPILERALNNIPQEFLAADQEKLLATANMKATIRVFESLNSVRPALNRYLPLVKEWNVSFQKASTDYAQLKQTGARLRQSFQNPPSGLIIDPLRGRLDHVAQRAAEVGQDLTSPEVEELKPLAREANQLLRVLQDTERQYSLAQKHLGELNQILAELSNGIKNLAAQLKASETRPVYPLVWDRSSVKLNDLTQRLDKLGPANKPRTPEEIRQLLKECMNLRREYTALAEKAPQTTAQHTALVAILESQQIKEGAVWLRKSREMLAETDGYDPKNWPKQDSLPTLQIEVEKLAQRHAQLVPADPASPIKETDLEQRLKDTQELAEQHKSIAPRVDNIRSRPDRLKALEAEGKEKLTEAWTALDQVDLLTDSNALLEEIASGDIDLLMEEIRVLGNELSASDEGEVEKKSQKIRALSDKVNGTFNLWLTRLNSAAAELGKQIRDRLIELDAVTLLDDPPIEQARRAIENPDYLSTAYSEPSSPSSSPTSSARSVMGRVAARIPRIEHKSSLTNLEAMTEIKRKNDLWQTLHAVQKGLEERSAPLLAAYQEAVQARNESKERLAEVDKLATEKRSWPPIHQPSNQEIQALKPIDEKWNGFKKQRGSAEWAILELGRLARDYRIAAEHVKNVLDRVRQDQEKVQDQEWQIESLKQRWLTQSEPSNPVMRESIRQLLSQNDSKVAYIKQQYLRGVLTYEQTVENLKLLQEDLRSARVPIDENNMVGLNDGHRRAEQA